MFVAMLHLSFHCLDVFQSAYHKPGNKKDNITVIYTPWSNLKKDGSMAVGQVGFKNNKQVKRIHVQQRENPIVNRLNKTKVEKFPDLKEEKEARQKELRGRDRDAQQARVSFSCFFATIFVFSIFVYYFDWPRARWMDLRCPSFTLPLLHIFHFAVLNQRLRMLTISSARKKHELQKNEKSSRGREIMPTTTS